MNNYQQALSDVEEAIKLDDDISAKTLKGEIEQILEMNKRETEIKE